MILDSINNAELYYSVTPLLAKAFEYLKSVELNSMESGRYEIDGDNLFMNIMERELKKPSDAKLEVHNNYADIQIVISGDPEGFGYIPREELVQPSDEFNTTKDIQFFEDIPQTIYFIYPGQFTLLLPGDGHAPLIGEGVVKKAVIKVKL